jgi:hypothetical protein
LPQTARDGSRVSDELPDADIARLGVWTRHDGSIPGRTTPYHRRVEAIRP